MPSLFQTLCEQWNSQLNLLCFDPSVSHYFYSYIRSRKAITTWKRGGRGSSVGRARDFWSGGPGFDPRCGRPLPTGWVGVSIMWPAEIEVMVSQLCLMCGSTQNCQTLCLGAGPRYNLVVDEDVKKTTNQHEKEGKQWTTVLAGAGKE